MRALHALAVDPVGDAVPDPGGVVLGEIEPPPAAVGEGSGGEELEVVGEAPAVRRARALGVEAGGAGGHLAALEVAAVAGYDVHHRKECAVAVDGGRGPADDLDPLH